MMRMKLLTALLLSLNPLVSYANNLLPVAAHWCIDSSVIGCSGQTLAAWKENDVINHFYSQKTPLATTIKIANVQNTLQVIPFIDFSTANTPAQMSKSEALMPQISFWQYMQRFTYFGGSQGEGQVLAPEPGWIKAAHQNGVKILGCIFFSPISYGGDKELIALNNMLNDPTTYAKQLVNIANVLGFDGYFINNEADESITTNNKFATFIQVFHDESKKQNVDLTLDWYQVPANSASSLNKNLFVDANGNRISDNVFLDYGWVYDPSAISKTVNSWNYPLSQLDFGIYDAVYHVGMSHQALYDMIFPNQLGSISEFAFEEILNPNNKQITANQQLDNETHFWLGSPGWNGAAHQVSMNTAISELPFSTSFNTGQGTRYFLKGIDTQWGAWYDMGQQDLLPSWRFQVDNALGNHLTTAFDYDDSYMGGSNLMIQGTISPHVTTTVDLYATHLDLSMIQNSIQAHVISKMNATNIATVQLCLHTIENDISCFALNPGMTWGETNNELSSVSKKIIDKIYLTITGLDSIPKNTNYNFKLGYIFVGSDAESQLPEAPLEVHMISQDKDAKDQIHYYVAWDPVPNAKYYNIYVDGNWAGRTNQTIFDIVSTKSSTTIAISAVNSYGAESKLSFL